MFLLPWLVWLGQDGLAGLADLAWFGWPVLVGFPGLAWLSWLAWLGWRPEDLKRERKLGCDKRTTLACVYARIGSKRQAKRGARGYGGWTKLCIGFQKRKL